MNEELFKLYRDMETYPDFLGCTLTGPNDTGHFLNTPLHFASTQGNLAGVVLLLSEGADINRPGDRGYTPLHDAVESSREDVVKLLVARGADLNAVNDFTCTPLELAEILECPESIKQILIRAMADHG